MSQPKVLKISEAGNDGIPATFQLLEDGFPNGAFAQSHDHRKTGV